MTKKGITSLSHTRKPPGSRPMVPDMSGKPFEVEVECHTEVDETSLFELTLTSLVDTW